MASLNYSIQINAPKEKVWNCMLEPDSYKVWTDAFHPGSLYVGDWEKGNKLLFTSVTDGEDKGIVGQIIEHIPYEYTCIEMLGQLVNGELDTTSADTKDWIGAHESYRFSEQDGVTTVDVELDSPTYNPEIKEMFDSMWPNGLNKLKEIAEQA